jgi:hypothetical protein
MCNDDDDMCTDQRDVAELVQRLLLERQFARPFRPISPLDER